MFVLYAIIAAFSTYTCMYALRKVFTVATFKDISYWGFDYKILLISAQVIGYMLSKFIGIKVISEMKKKYRGVSILLLIGIAELALVLFAYVPAPWNIVFMFLNGLPLGMVWGLVFSYLEGRKTTEILGAGLSISFIISSGLVKSAGKYLMTNFGVSDLNVPFITGAVFLIPLLLFVWMLERIPEPSAEDETLRVKREPMDLEARKKFFLTFSTGIILLTLIYMLLTVYRDLRDNFAADIWNELGYSNEPMIFTITEIPIGVLIMIMVGALMWIKDNKKALIINHYMVMLGFALVAISLFLFQQHMIAAPLWMVLIGLGLYMGYVPFNCILFDRFIAAAQTAGNAGFLIYIADSFGYLASVGVLFYKNFGQPSISWFNFFKSSGYVVALFGIILTAISVSYIKRKEIKAATPVMQNINS